MKSKAPALPYILWMVLFTIIPLGLVVFFAFTSDSNTFTLDSFKSILQYTPVLLKSLKLATIATVICLLLGYPAAFIMSRAEVKAQRMIMMLIMLPMWMNFLLRTYAWMTLLEGTGLINSLFSLVGLGPFKMINTEGAVVVGMVYNYLPFMVLPLYSIMEKIDKSVIEAAQDLGSNGRKVLVKVLLPLSMPGIVTGVTMVFVPAVSTFIISRLLGGGKHRLIGDLIEKLFIGDAPDFHAGSAMALILMVIMLICMGFMNRLDDEDKEGMVI